MSFGCDFGLRISNERGEFAGNRSIFGGVLEPGVGRGRLHSVAGGFKG